MSTEILKILSNFSKNEDGNYTLSQSSVDDLTREAQAGQDRTDSFRKEAETNRKKKGETKKQLEDLQTQYTDLESNFTTRNKEYDELNTSLESNNQKLQGFYEQRKTVLKGFSETYNVLEDEKYEKIKGRFEGIQELDKLAPEKVEQLISDFELLTVTNAKATPKTPTPTKTPDALQTPQTPFGIRYKYNEK